MTETAPDVGEHEGSIPSYCCRLFGTGIGDRLHADCARKIRPRGSIVTKEDCDANGGTFHPIIFNWMVHVYPMEKDNAAIWSVERQAPNKGGT